MPRRDPDPNHCAHCGACKHCGAPKVPPVQYVPMPYPVYPPYPQMYPRPITYPIYPYQVTYGGNTAVSGTGAGNYSVGLSALSSS